MIPVMIHMVQMNHIDCNPTCRVKWCLLLSSRVFLSPIFVLSYYYDVYVFLPSPIGEAKGGECSDPHQPRGIMFVTIIFRWSRPL
jgi:hypothetical protein